MDISKEFPIFTQLAEEFDKIKNMEKKADHMHRWLKEILMILDSLEVELSHKSCESITYHSMLKNKRDLKKIIDKMWP